jgi:hypothetical protein
MIFIHFVNILIFLFISNVCKFSDSQSNITALFEGSAVFKVPWSRPEEKSRKRQIVGG